MNRILEKIQKIGIVPVVVLDDPKDAAPLAEALCKGGLPCAEVTFRTAAAEESIRIMTECFPDMLVGAGTVLTIEQADRARAAGARFIVSPGLNPAVVRHCMEIGIPVIPGTQRCGGGDGTWSGRGEILPGRTGRRHCHDQGHVRSLYTDEIYAHRRR